MNEIPADKLLDMAHELRLLVFMENEEHDGFTQVLLTTEQFKKVSDAIVRDRRKAPELREGYEICRTEHGDIVLPQELFEGMNSIDN